MSQETRRWSGEYLLYASTIFLSAFLLFVVQPMVGKHLLPWFGGSSSVWATSLLFFTTMLFVGYLYVYFITRLAPKRQAFVHLGVVIACAVFAILGRGTSLDWTIGSETAPALNVLLALFMMIGAPYFLLSTTGPLMQYWWGLSSNREPYKLYALSNAGSLLALIAFVVLFEPTIPLTAGQTAWTVFFILYALCAATVSVAFARRTVILPASGAADNAKTPLKSILKWIALAAFPSFLLLATTTSITQTIAPVPLLWIIPLMLYLLTLIVAFAGYGQTMFVPLTVLVSVYLVYSYFGLGAAYLTRAVAANLGFLFLTSLMCHAWLYRLRPAVKGLPLFYVFVSLGGAIGVLLASMIVPLVFWNFSEFPLAMAIAAALAAWALHPDFFPRILDDRNIALTKIAAILLSGGIFLNFIFTNAGSPFLASRNFYGAVKIRFDDSITVLLHGSTIHGYQAREKEWEMSPNSYYVPGSGIARAIRYEQELRKESKDFKIAVLGLGAGSIAVYCRPGDSFVFYEIDPRMVGIAESMFSYMRHCKGAQVRIGDGRLLLEKERRDGNLGGYDIIAADAFTDDSIPVHLVTQQAIALYMAHARSPQSIVAVHTSNRYIDLPPTILKIAASLGLTAKVINHDGGDSDLGSASEWVLIAKDPKVFEHIAFEGTKFYLPDVKSAPLWTDDYSSVLSVFRW